MKRCPINIAFALVGMGLIAGCKKDIMPQSVVAPNPQGSGKTSSSSVVSLIVGSHVWHGFHLWDANRDTMIGVNITIIAVNDSVIVTSDIPNWQLPYSKTDSVSHTVLFTTSLAAPPMLFYNFGAVLI